MQKLQILKCSFFIVILLIAFHQKLLASVTTELKQIPYEDRILLKVFFRDFFLHDSLGHVLFFETKPVCFTGFSIEAHHQHFFEKLFAKGWVCWKKYEHLFPHPNFIFIEEEVLLSENSRMLQIFVINKSACIKCLREHEDIFKDVLGEEFTAETFIAQVEKNKVLRPLIKDDESLLGLIMGFGRESSLAFKKQHAFLSRKDFCPPLTENYRGIHPNAPKKCLIFPVGFVGNPNSSEVQNLVLRYENELEALWSKYQHSRNTLMLVLEQLCASSEIYNAIEEENSRETQQYWLAQFPNEKYNKEKSDD